MPPKKKYPTTKKELYDLLVKSGKEFKKPKKNAVESLLRALYKAGYRIHDDNGVLSIKSKEEKKKMITPANFINNILKNSKSTDYKIIVYFIVDIFKKIELDVRTVKRGISSSESGGGSEGLSEELEEAIKTSSESELDPDNPPTADIELDKQQAAEEKRKKEIDEALLLEEARRAKESKAEQRTKKKEDIEKENKKREDLERKLEEKRRRQAKKDEEKAGKAETLLKERERIQLAQALEQSKATQAAKALEEVNRASEEALKRNIDAENERAKKARAEERTKTIEAENQAKAKKASEDNEKKSNIEQAEKTAKKSELTVKQKNKEAEIQKRKQEAEALKRTKDQQELESKKKVVESLEKRDEQALKAKEAEDAKQRAEISGKEKAKKEAEQALKVQEAEQAALAAEVAQKTKEAEDAKQRAEISGKDKAKKEAEQARTELDSARARYEKALKTTEDLRKITLRNIERQTELKAEKRKELLTLKSQTSESKELYLKKLESYFKKSKIKPKEDLTAEDILRFEQSGPLLTPIEERQELPPLEAGELPDYIELPPTPEQAAPIEESPQVAGLELRRSSYVRRLDELPPPDLTPEQEIAVYLFNFEDAEQADDLARMMVNLRNIEKTNPNHPEIGRLYDKISNMMDVHDKEFEEANRYGNIEKMNSLALKREEYITVLQNSEYNEDIREAIALVRDDVTRMYTLLGKRLDDRERAKKNKKKQEKVLIQQSPAAQPIEDPAAQPLDVTPERVEGPAIDLGEVTREEIELGQQLSIMSTEQQKKSEQILRDIDALNANSQPGEVPGIEKANEVSMVENTQLAEVPLEQSFEQQDNSQAAQAAQLSRQPGRATVRAVELGIPRLGRLNREERERDHQINAANDGGDDSNIERALVNNEVDLAVDRAEKPAETVLTEPTKNTAYVKKAKAVYLASLETSLLRLGRSESFESLIEPSLPGFNSPYAELLERYLTQMGNKANHESLLRELSALINDVKKELRKDYEINPVVLDILLHLINLLKSVTKRAFPEDSTSEAIRRNVIGDLDNDYFKVALARISESLRLSRERARTGRLRRRLDKTKRLLQKQKIPIKADNLLDRSQSLGSNPVSPGAEELNEAVEELSDDIAENGVTESNMEYIVRLIKIMSLDTKQVVIDVLKNDPYNIFNPSAVIKPLLLRFLGRILYTGSRVTEEEAEAYVRTYYTGASSLVGIYSGNTIRKLLSYFVERPPDLPEELRPPEERESFRSLTTRIIDGGEDLADFVEITSEELEGERLKELNRKAMTLVSQIVSIDSATVEMSDRRVIREFLNNPLIVAKVGKSNVNKILRRMSRAEIRVYSNWVRRINESPQLTRSIFDEGGRLNPVITMLTRARDGTYQFTQRFIDVVRSQASRIETPTIVSFEESGLGRALEGLSVRPPKPRKKVKYVDVELEERKASRPSSSDEEPLYEIPIEGEGVEYDDVVFEDIGKAAQAAATVAAFGSPTPREEVGLFRKAFDSGLNSLPSIDNIRETIKSTGTSVSKLSADIARQVMPTLRENPNIRSNYAKYIALAIAGVIAATIYKYVTTEVKPEPTKDFSRGETTEFYKGKAMPVPVDDKDTPQGLPLLRPEFKMLGIDFFDGLYSRKTFGEQNSEWAHFDYVNSIDNTNGIEVDNDINEKIRYSGDLIYPKYVKPDPKPPQTLYNITEYPMMDMYQLDQEFRAKFDSAINKFDNLNYNVNRYVLPMNWQSNILYNF